VGPVVHSVDGCCHSGLAHGDELAS
jgi:hypothetical protein